MALLGRYSYQGHKEVVATHSCWTSEMNYITRFSLEEKLVVADNVSSGCVGRDTEQRSFEWVKYLAQNYGAGTDGGRAFCRDFSATQNARRYPAPEISTYHNR